MSAVEMSSYLCVSCPLGCRLEVDAVDGDIVEIRGFACKRGERYAKQEHTNPRRHVSTTVAITGAGLPRLPVRAAEPVPKAQVRALVEALAAIEVTAPVARGAVVLEDAAGTGVDVIATRHLARTDAN